MQDQRRLRDHRGAGAKERRREDMVALHLHRHGLHAPRSPRDVDILGTRVLEREADEFAASLDARPVIELVSHNTAGLSLSSLGFKGPGGKFPPTVPVTHWN